jgi:ABC-type dipeptide/oligopeptide/nickel transport system permease component
MGRLLFYSMPTFVLGFRLILGLHYEFAIRHVGSFPAPGTWTPYSRNPLQWTRALVLPWTTAGSSIRERARLRSRLSWTTHNGRRPAPLSA